MTTAVPLTGARFPRTQLTVLRVGHCVHPQCLAMRGGAWRVAEFPALVGLIRHPTAGAILFDTGYSDHFMRATAGFPERLYRWATPVALPPEQCLQTQLAQQGIAMHEVAAVFASHLHADHIAGLRDLPRSAIWCSDAAVRHMHTMSRLSRLSKATLTELLPDDFGGRHHTIESCASGGLPERWSALGDGFDLIGDASLWAVPLPGHARGQMGLLLRHVDDREYLLAADVAWDIDELREDRAPAWPTRLLADDWAAHRGIRTRLHRLLHSALRAGDDGICMLPSHCANSYRTLPASMQGTLPGTTPRASPDRSA